ncbi:condensation domain-containing protein [Streptomyces sp. NPDC049916]|uniref:condensation domain-containing protein n=1 Tax=Streptomyces sp. NPDC049916 TaxID=3155156 RepID=UPI00342D28D3
MSSHDTGTGDTGTAAVETGSGTGTAGDTRSGTVGTGTLTVRFSGLRSGSAPMSWGQQAIWKSINWLAEEAHYFNLARVVALPGGTTTDGVLGVLGELIARHEALRSTFTDGPDGPVQRVYGSGSATVAVHAAPADAPGPPDEADAQALADRLAATPFRNGEEFGMRYAVLTHAGEPVWLVMVVSHQATDYGGVRVMEAELARLLRGESLEPVEWQPLDQARHQQEGEGARRGRAALDHWERALSTAPTSHFDFPPPPDGAGEDDPGRFVRLRLASVAGAVAAQRLADRCRVSTSTVLLTAAAATLAAYTGHDRAVMLLIAGNRNEPRLQSMVGAQTENALFVLAPGEGTFEDAVRGGFLPTMSAYRYGEYDPAAMDEVHERVGRARGRKLDLSAFFNDVRMRDRWDALPDTGDDPEALLALRAGSEVSFIGSWARQDAKYFVHTPYCPDRLHLYLMADTHYLPVPVIEGLLRAMETLLVESVHGKVTPAEALRGLTLPTADRAPDTGA